MQNKGKQKEKHVVHVALDAFYKHYCNITFKETIGRKRVVHKDSKYCISRSIYGKILSEFNFLISQEIIYDNFEYKLPAKLGVLSIKKKKPKIYVDVDGKVINKLPIDWKSTLSLWEEDEDCKRNKKLIRHLNEHTNGYVPFWSYNVNSGTYKNKKLYKFIATRTNKREVTRAVNDKSLKINYYLK